MAFVVMLQDVKAIAISLYHDVLSRLGMILKAVFNHPEMLWILVPITLSMILISYYFGKYKKEELGWNTAFGNGVVLLFACVDLFRYLYNEHILGLNPYTLLVTVVLFEGVFLTLLDFLHALPKSFAFALSSGMTVNTISLCLILLVYGKIPLDYITAIAVAIMASVIVLLLRIMQLLEFEEDDADE